MTEGLAPHIGPQSMLPAWGNLCSPDGPHMWGVYLQGQFWNMHLGSFPSQKPWPSFYGLCAAPLASFSEQNTLECESSWGTPGIHVAMESLW